MRRLVLFCAILIFSISTVFRLVLFSVSSIQFEESIEKNGALDINDTQQDKTTLDNEGVHNETIWRKDHHEQEDNDAHIVGYRFKRDDVNRHTNDTTLFQNTDDGNFNPNFMDDFVFTRRPKYFSSKYDRIYGTIHNPCVSTLTPRYERTNVTVSSCEELHLPLKDFFRLPEKCLPRVVLLPSHPVSGNGLTRNLFMHVTGLSTVKLQRPDNIPQKHARIYRLGEDSWNLLTPMDQICKEGLEVPFKSRVALTKTHYPGDNKNMFQELHKTFNDDISNVFVTHVVRLVRNPGDHMIRQSKKKVDCGGIINKMMYKWKFFHTYWSRTYDSSKPRMILHYENLSDKRKSASEMRKLLDFVGEMELEAGILDEKVQEIVIEPTYEQGTLLTRMCGKNVSKTVHEFTKSLTEEMGYKFDDDLGKWFLMEEV